MKISTKAGATLAECDPNLMPSVLVGLGLTVDSVVLEYTADESKQLVRQKINEFADSASREGVLSDVLGIVVVGLSQLTVGLSKAKSLAEINAAAAPLAEIGAAIDSAVKSGALKMPYMVKTGGVQGVLADMIALNNGLAQVLSTPKSPAELAG